MITNNYKTLMRAVFQGTGDVYVKDYSGATKYIAIATDDIFTAGTCFARMLTQAKTSGSHGVFFGTGTTPASASDYMLESKVSSSEVTVVNPESYQRLVGADGKITYTVTYTLTNITTADVTIGEIGLVVPTKTVITTSVSPSGSGTTSYILADHTVLDEPLTIPAGEVRALTYNIVFDMSFV